MKAYVIEEEGCLPKVVRVDHEGRSYYVSIHYGLDMGEDCNLYLGSIKLVQPKEDPDVMDRYGKWILEAIRTGFCHVNY